MPLHRRGEGREGDAPVVLDVIERDVMARTAEWTAPDGPRVRTPLLLEVRASRLPGDVPGCEAALVPSRAEGPGLLQGESPLVVRDLGSDLRPVVPDAAWAHLELPGERPVPPSIADELEGVPLVTVGRDAIVEVTHLPPSPELAAPPSAGATELVVLGGAACLLGRHDALVDAVMAARKRAGPARLLYAPAVATPMDLALLAYMGVDVVDDVQARLEAAGGVALRPELTHGHDLRDAPRPPLRGDDELAACAREGVLAMRREVALVREAIARGQLRELLEQRVRSEPWQVAALRHLDRHHNAALERRSPVQRPVRLLATSRDSFHRVEVRAWVDRLLARYAPPPSAKVLVLLPCSARKPYSSSRTHRAFLSALRDVRNRWAVHEVVLTSPLGMVPRELERTYPAAHYDIPVTGEWFPEEVERMAALLAHLRRAGAYSAVISHMGPGLPFVENDATVTRTRTGGEGPLDAGALGRLAEAASSAAALVPRVDRARRDLEDLASLARLQFGPEAGAALLRDARLAGKPPAWRLALRGGGQLASLVPDRGLLSLTLEGAERVATAGRYRVLMDDFELKGNLFAVGVSGADPEVREGDDVAVVRGDRVVAVGVARMGAEEMVGSRRGIAVAVRHRRGEA